MLERVPEQIVNPKFVLGPGLTFEQYTHRDGNVAGVIYGPDDWPSPIELVITRHPFCAFRAEWYLPDGLERPASFSSMKVALEHAAKLLDPKRMEDHPYAMRVASKSEEPPAPKVVKETFHGSLNKVFGRELSYSDGGKEWVFIAPDKWLGEVRLYQSPAKEPIMTVYEMPKKMILGDSWTNPDTLLKHLATTPKEKLFSK